MSFLSHRKNKFAFQGMLLAIGAVTVFAGATVFDSGFSAQASSRTINYAISSPMKLGHFPTQMALHESSQTIYISDWTDGTLSVLDAKTNAVKQVISVGNTAPQGVAVSQKTGDVYVALMATSKIAVVRENKVVDTIDVGITVSGLSLDEATQTLYVSNPNERTTTAIRLSDKSILGAVAVGWNPDAMVFDASSQQLYVANRGSKTVSVIDVTDPKKLRLATSFSVQEGPAALALDSQGKILYVANRLSNTVSVVNLSTGVVDHTISVGNAPAAIAFDATTQRTYVLNVDDDTVSIFDGGFKVAQTLSVGQDTTTMIAIPASHTFYVASSSFHIVTLKGDEKDCEEHEGDSDECECEEHEGDSDECDEPGEKGFVQAVQERISPWITSLAPPAGSVGVPYSFTVIAEGFPDPEFSFSGDLPPGLSFSQTGLLSGKPTTLGTFKFRVIASNSVAPNAVADYVLTFAAGTGRSQDPNNPGGSGGSGSGTAGSGSTAFLGSAASSNRGAGLPNTGLVFDGLWPAIAVVLLATGALTLTTQRKKKTL